MMFLGEKMMFLSPRMVESLKDLKAAKIQKTKNVISKVSAISVCLLSFVF